MSSEKPAAGASHKPARSFRRVPKGIWGKLGPSPGAACEEAIRDLLDLRHTEPIVYRAVGTGGKRHNVRISDSLYDEMRDACAEDGVHINEFFITALRHHVGDT